MRERTSIFDNPATLDVSDFQPKAQPAAGPRSDEIDQASRGGRFRSREPSPELTVGRPPTKRPPMVYRTGRNATLSVKTTPETIEQFYAIARAQEWKAAETFEYAVAALERELRGEAAQPITEARKKEG